MLHWTKTPWGWTATHAGVRWTVRGPIMGHPMFWVFRNGIRFLHGTALEPVPCRTAKAAKDACTFRAMAESLSTLPTPKDASCR